MNNAIKSTAHLTTPELFELTKAALATKTWGFAHRLLDDLSARADNAETLPAADGRPEVIQDRVDLVNAKADW